MTSNLIHPTSTESSATNSTSSSASSSSPPLTAFLSPTSRRGKIARLPVALRDDLNRRLEEGESATEILPWLNALPEVQAVLAAEFAGAPISEQNLSLWRQGGFQDWLRVQEARALAGAFLDQSNTITQSTGAQSVACLLAASLALALGRWLHAATPAAADATPDQFRALLPIARELANLRRLETRETRVRIERERWEAEQAKAVEKKLKDEEYQKKSAEHDASREAHLVAAREAIARRRAETLAWLQQTRTIGPTPSVPTTRPSGLEVDPLESSGIKVNQG